jgi:hypothetical protein
MGAILKQSHSCNTVLDYADFEERHSARRRSCSRILFGADVDASHFDKTMLVKDCASELRNAKARFKDVLAEAILSSDLYEFEVATSRVERRYPHLTEDNVFQAKERE